MKLLIGCRLSLPEAAALSGVGDTEAGDAGADTKSCRLTYSEIGGEEKGETKVLKLVTDVYRVEVNLILERNFWIVSNHAEIYAFRLFVYYLKIANNIIVVFSNDQIGRETTAIKCICHMEKVLLTLPICLHGVIIN